jgi:TolB-like protein/Tfp pilus assembly protein PilF
MSEDTDPEHPKPLSVDRLSILWRRINDHKMVQWGVAYVALAYAIQHAVILTSESFEWPHVVSRISMLLLAVGLPVVMTLAWYHGQRASRRISGPELTIISILFVIGSLFFYVFVQPSAEVATKVAPATQKPPTVGSRLPAPTVSGIAIAVLPFLNLSREPDQDFFSDGMTEEITSALAKVPGLRVLGRTSAFKFKGQNQDLRSIGQELGATHLIEGSVRKDGNQIRITAQLVRADDGTYLWSESYDRELKGVFAVQENIAQAIAASLRVPLGLKQGQNLVSNRTSDIAAYEDYLRARALVRQRGLREPAGPMAQATRLLEQVVARDPNYAPAWGLLGQAYALTTYSGSDIFTDDVRRFTAELLQKAEAAAQQATRLDPSNSDGYTALGLARTIPGRFVQAEDFLKQALSLDAGNPDALNEYSLMLLGVGRLKDALAMRLRLQVQEPFVPIFNVGLARALWANGRNEEAIAILKAQPTFFIRSRILAEVYASTGRYGEAADTLRAIPSRMVATGAVEEAIRLLRTAPAQDNSRQAIPLGRLGFVYLYVGAPDRALDAYEDLAEAGYPDIRNAPSALWTASYAPVRKTERFKTYVRKAGMVDYWRTRGWPDLCHPTGTDDFVCD